jgi:hypothetical protein
MRKMYVVQKQVEQPYGRSWRVRTWEIDKVFYDKAKAKNHLKKQKEMNKTNKYRMNTNIQPIG